MRSNAAVRTALVAVLLTSSAIAQTVSFGEPFPLTNTRYGVEASIPVLVSNGQDIFAFWQTSTNIRMTRLVEGERRGGRNAFSRPSSPGSWSVTWTGKHFLVAGAYSTSVSGQLLTASGELVGAAFHIADADSLSHPRLASNGTTVLLIYNDSGAVHRVTMTPGGEVTARSVLFDRSSNASAAPAIASDGRGFAAVVPANGDVNAVTFDAHGEEISRRFLHVRTFPYSLGPVTIASNNDHYLVAWQVAGSGVSAATLTPEGASSAAVNVEPLDTTSLSSTWTGSEWAITYAVNEGQNRRVRIAYLDETASSVLRRDDIPGAAYPSIAAANGRAIAAWRDVHGPTVASTLPLGSSERWFAAYAATSQIVYSAASSATAMLVVWRESLDGVVETRVGVRHQDGRWFERSLGRSGSIREVFAASDGRNFAVVKRRSGGTATVILIDDRARPAAPAVELAMDARAVASTGSGYLVAGDAFGGAYVVRVTHAGASAPILVAPEKEVTAIAASGDRALVALLDPEPCHITCPGTYGRVMYVRLNANLSPAEAPQRISGEQAFVDHAAAIWDGAKFVVAWLEEERIQIEAVPRAGASTRTSSLAARPAEGLQLVRTEEGAILTWREQSETLRAMIRIARLNGGSSPSIQTLETAWFRQRGLLVPLPEGRLAHVAARANYAAPHHGSTRVFMQIGSVITPELPGSPAISALHARDRVRLTWIPPAGPVNGYRVEYRIGDGSWHELDEWFEADEFATTLTWTVRPGVPYSFRVRAFSDAGASAYSVPATINQAKRRSVR